MTRTVIADIRNNRFPAITIEAGTWVVWRNLDPYVHSAKTLLGRHPAIDAYRAQDFSFSYRVDQVD